MGWRIGGARCIMSAVWEDIVAARSDTRICDCEVMVWERPAMAGLAPKMFANAVSLAPVGGPFCGRANSLPCWLP
jgi:hypothetical protein